jgi:hypothetical protein
VGGDQGVREEEEEGVNPCGVFFVYRREKELIEFSQRVFIGQVAVAPRPVKLCGNSASPFLCGRQKEAARPLKNSYKSIPPKLTLITNSW